MNAALPGAGTLLNITTVVVGSLLGMAVGNRLPKRVKAVVTDCLGLVTLLMAFLSALSVNDAPFTVAVGRGVPMLIVLGSLVLGATLGSLLRIEQRMAALAGGLQHRWNTSNADSSASGRHEAKERFIEGWLTASLLYCVGPLTILGSLNDGLGRGIDQLVLKSVLDGFASVAFAASFGVGVLLSAVSVGVVQGGLTGLGLALGTLLPDAHISALTATGGLMLIGISIRLLRLRDIPVGDFLPALVLAPLITQLVVVLR